MNQLLLVVREELEPWTSLLQVRRPNHLNMLPRLLPPSIEKIKKNLRKDFFVSFRVSGHPSRMRRPITQKPPTLHSSGKRNCEGNVRSRL